MASERIVCSLLFVFFVFCIAESQAGQFCYKNRYHTWETTYCNYGCCGHNWDEYCCGMQVGLIVGCVFAGIMGICIIVAVVCCCIKKQSHSGRVVHPSTTTAPRPGANVTVVYTGTSGQYPGPAAYGGGMAQPMQPPPYKQHDNPPPAYHYSDPAYPPTAPAYPPPTTSANIPTAPATPAASSVTPQAPPPGFNVPSSTAPPSTSLRQ